MRIVVNNPMVFNANRSYIHSKETINNKLPPYNLYIPQGGHVNDLADPIKLLLENLMKLYRGLFEMQSSQFQRDKSFFEDEKDILDYPNQIVGVLNKICEYQH